MTEFEPNSKRGVRERWDNLMERTKGIKDRIWGNEKIPDREDDSE
jgi:hypothetical protein